MISLNLRGKITCAVSLLVVGMIAIGGWIGFSFFEGQLKEAIARQQFPLVSAMAEETDGKIALAQNELRAVALESAPLLNDPLAVQRLIDGRIDSRIIFDHGIFVFAADGRIVAGSAIDETLRNTDFSRRDYFRSTVAARKRCISDPFLSLRTQTPIVMFTEPVFDKDGRLKAIVAGSIELLKDNFLGRLSTVRLGKAGYLYLYSDKRTMIVHPDRTRILKRDVPPGSNRLFDKAIEGFEGTGETVTSRGLPVLSSFKRLKNVPWILAANMPRAEVYEPVARAKTFLVSGLVVAMLLSGGVIYLFVSWLTVPLSRFTRHVRGITGSEGDPIPALVETDDEIGVLATAFNQMLHKLDVRKEALKEALAEAEGQRARSEAIIDAIGDGISIHDRNFRIVYQNENQKCMTGDREGELCHSAYVECSSPCSDCPIVQSFRDGKVHRATKRVLRTGGLSDVEITISPLRNNAGEVVAAIEVIRDVTERKEVEEALRQSNETLQTVIEASPLAIVMMDPEERVLLWNPAARRLLGWTEDDILGQRIPWLPPWEPECLHHNRVMEGETLTGLELRRFRKNGTMIDLSVAAAPLFDVQGAVVGVISIIEDVSERKQAEQALRRAKEDSDAMMEELGESNRSLLDAIKRASRLAVAADAANRAKSEFLANMSHEIRTPMNGIIGMTDLTLDTELTVEQREYLQMARHSAETLMTLINEILDLSKIEAGKLELEQVDFVLSDVTDAALRVLLPQARQKGISLRCHIDPKVPPVLNGDPARLRDLLVNLAGNAVKFTERGIVNVTVERGEIASEESASLVFSVKDTGIGIPADKIESIFDTFTQADGSTTRKYGGTGLGLAIARKIVAMMGGNISVESEVGKGSVFSFAVSLPVGTGTPAADIPVRPGLTASPIAGRGSIRVLLAEDNAVNRNLATRILEKAGFSVTGAGNGKQVLAALQADRFDLVLMDVQMPEMDGLETTQLIRSGTPGIDPHIPIVAITAHALKGDREWCLSAGMDDYIPKPLSADTLLSVIAQVLGIQGDRDIPPPPKETEFLGTLHVNDALEMVGGDEQLLRELWALFVQTAPGQFHRLSLAFRKQNLVDAAHNAHALKGASATIGASRLKELAAQVEQACRAKECQAVENLLKQMDEELDAVLAALGPETERFLPLVSQG